MVVYQRAAAKIAKRDDEGNGFLESNSFSVLADNDIMDKALEIGIDVSSISMGTVHMLKDLEHARAVLVQKKDQLIAKDVVCSKEKRN